MTRHVDDEAALMYAIAIDPEFSALIPPLSADERAQLETNLARDGCREPLVVWNGVLLDGHNRYEICTRLGIAFDVVSLPFASRDEAADWIDANQLGRRNLSPEAASLIRGRRYNRTKKAANDGGKGTPKTTEDQNDPRFSTAERLATEHGVSAPTIKRDGQFATAVEALKPHVPDITPGASVSAKRWTGPTAP